MDEPTTTPITVNLRWIGHRRRYVHRTDQAGWGIYTLVDGEQQPVIDVDYKWEAKREVPWVGVTQRILCGDRSHPEWFDQKLKGLTGIYAFGPEPGTFTQFDMPYGDYLIILAAWDGAKHEDGTAMEFPFQLVGADDDGGQIDTAAHWRGEDPFAEDVEAMVIKAREANNEPLRPTENVQVIDPELGAETNGATVAGQ